MNINIEEVVTKVITYGLIGVFAIGLHLITAGAIDGHSDQETRITKLEQHHTDSLIPPKKKSVPLKIWNWITFKEFRIDK